MSLEYRTLGELVDSIIRTDYEDIADIVNDVKSWIGDGIAEMARHDLSFFEKEADHVEGFAKECAVVTHYRLRKREKGKGLEVDPDAKLEEELIIRPT